MNRKATPFPNSTSTSSTTTMQNNNKKNKPYLNNNNNRRRKTNNNNHTKKTLSTTLLNCLIGKSLQVEIKNGCKISGILDEVDSLMNLTIGNTTTTFPPHLKLQSKHAELTFIQGTRIRFVSFEENVNSLLKNNWERNEKQRQKNKRQWISNNHVYSKEEEEEEEKKKIKLQ